MPPVGGEIFSALAQEAHWWLQGCHRTQAGTAVQPQPGPPCVQTALLLLLAREMKEMPSRIKCQSSKRFLLLPLVPIPVESFDPKGEPVCPDGSTQGVLMAKLPVPWPGCAACMGVLLYPLAVPGIDVTPSSTHH